MLITRAAEQARELVEALKDCGAVPIIFPVIRIVPPKDFGPFDAALRRSREFDWILFTSQNAVKAVRERASELRIDLQRACGHVKAGAVGRATAEEAQLAGFRVTHVASRAQGLALVDDLGAEFRSKKILFPRSDRANPELVRALEACGARVTEVIAYRTVSGETGGDAGRAEVARADAVLFFSPSAVTGFREIAGLQAAKEFSERGVIAAIGPVTNAALKAAGIERAIVAEDASVAGIVDALADFFRRQEHAASSGAKTR